MVVTFVGFELRFAMGRHVAGISLYRCHLCYKAGLLQLFGESTLSRFLCYVDAKFGDSFSHAHLFHHSPIVRSLLSSLFHLLHK